jgi:hypothetical protein
MIRQVAASFPDHGVKKASLVSLILDSWKRVDTAIALSLGKEIPLPIEFYSPLARFIQQRINVVCIIVVNRK